jgi:hypothetical protein
MLHGDELVLEHWSGRATSLAAVGLSYQPAQEEAYRKRSG